MGACGLETCAEEFERGDCGGGDSARGGASEEGGQGWAEGCEGRGSEGVVAGEVDYVCGDGHEEGWGEAAPEGGDAFVSCDFDEALPGAVEAPSGGLFDDAGVGEGGGGDGGGECDAGFGGVCDPEDFAAARGDAEFGRGEGRGGLEVEWGERELVGAEGSVAEGRGGGSRGAGGQSGVLRLQTDADDVEGGRCRP